MNTSKNNRHRVCTRTVLDDTVPGILFDENGVANYCKIHDRLMERYPRGSVGKKEWNSLVEKVKASGAGKKYDCIVGLSGGTDSCYLLHTVVEQGLRPLAVYLDNGWGSEIAVSNIRKMTSDLKVDLETYVIDYEEIKNILRAYIRAGLPWVDAPTDIAIRSAVYKIAAREGIKCILIGADFRSEGKQPTEWTYSDGKQLRHICRKFGVSPMKTFPNLTLFDLVYYTWLKGIKIMYPFHFIDYNKAEARALLESRYGWRYYGGHHHESIFTKFVIAHWLPKKFNIDKRKITFSAQIMSGQMKREEALEQLKEPPYDPELIGKDVEYVIKKLEFSKEEFQKIWNSSNKNFLDYPSYYPFIKRCMVLLRPFIKYFLSSTPLIVFEMDVRNKK